jgi:5-methylcytosine-specific restriction endonuclease McrA
MDSWNGFVHENVEILEELYQSDDFVMRWLESGNEKRKKDVLMRIHVAKACLVKREKTALATGDCAWCTLFPGEVKLKAEEIDHIIPFSFFPQFDGKEWNYQGLCKTHNSQKGSFPVPVQNKMPSQKMLHKIWAGLT